MLALRVHMLLAFVTPDQQSAQVSSRGPTESPESICVALPELPTEATAGDHAHAFSLSLLIHQTLPQVALGNVTQGSIGPGWYGLCPSLGC